MNTNAVKQGLLFCFFSILFYSSIAQNPSTKIITSFEKMKELAKPFGLEDKICGWSFLKFCDKDSINRYFVQQTKWEKDHAQKLAQYSQKPFRTTEELRILARKFNVEEEIRADSSLVYFDSTFAAIYLKLLATNHYYFMKKPQRTFAQQTEIATRYGFEDRIAKDSVLIYFDSTYVTEMYKHELLGREMFKQNNETIPNDYTYYANDMNYGIPKLTLGELLDIAKKYGAEKYLTSSYGLLFFRKETAEENFRSNAESGLKLEEMNIFSAARDTIKTMKQFYSILDKYPLAKADYIKNAGSIEKFEQHRNEEINRKYRIYKGKDLCNPVIWINDAIPYEKDE